MKKVKQLFKFRTGSSGKNRGDQGPDADSIAKDFHLMTTSLSDSQSIEDCVSFYNDKIIAIDESLLPGLSLEPSVTVLLGFYIPYFELSLFDETKWEKGLIFLKSAICLCPALADTTSSLSESLVNLIISLLNSNNQQLLEISKEFMIIFLTNVEMSANFMKGKNLVKLWKSVFIKNQITSLIFADSFISIIPSITYDCYENVSDFLDDVLQNFKNITDNALIPKCLEFIGRISAQIECDQTFLEPFVEILRPILPKIYDLTFLKYFLTNKRTKVHGFWDLVNDLCIESDTNMTKIRTFLDIIRHVDDLSDFKCKLLIPRFRDFSSDEQQSLFDCVKKQSTEYKFAFICNVCPPWENFVNIKILANFLVSSLSNSSSSSVTNPSLSSSSTIAAATNASTTTATSDSNAITTTTLAANSSTTTTTTGSMKGVVQNNMKEYDDAQIQTILDVFIRAQKTFFLHANDENVRRICFFLLANITHDMAIVSDLIVYFFTFLNDEIRLEKELSDEKDADKGIQDSVVEMSLRLFEKGNHIFLIQSIIHFLNSLFENKNENEKVQINDPIFSVLTEITLKYEDISQRLRENNILFLIKDQFHRISCIDFLSALANDGPCQEIDDFIEQNFETSALPAIKREYLLNLMLGLPHDSSFDGLIRIPSLCKFIDDVPIKTPFDKFTCANGRIGQKKEIILKCATFYIQSRNIELDSEYLKEISDPECFHFSIYQSHYSMRHSYAEFPSASNSLQAIWIYLEKLISLETVIIHSPNFKITVGLEEFKVSSNNSENNASQLNASASFPLKSWQLVAINKIDRTFGSNTIEVYLNDKKIAEIELRNNTSAFSENIIIGSEDDNFAIWYISQNILMSSTSNTNLKTNETNDFIQNALKNGPSCFSPNKLKCGPGMPFLKYRGIASFKNNFNIFSLLMKKNNTSDFLNYLKVAQNMCKIGIISRQKYYSGISYCLMNNQDICEELNGKIEEMFLQNNIEFIKDFQLIGMKSIKFNWLQDLNQYNIQTINPPNILTNSNSGSNDIVDIYIDYIIDALLFMKLDDSKVDLFIQIIKKYAFNHPEFIQKVFMIIETLSNTYSIVNFNKDISSITSLLINKSQKNNENNDNKENEDSNEDYNFLDEIDENFINDICIQRRLFDLYIHNVNIFNTQIISKQRLYQLIQNVNDTFALEILDYVSPQLYDLSLLEDCSFRFLSLASYEKFWLCMFSFLLNTKVSSLDQCSQFPVKQQNIFSLMFRLLTRSLHYEISTKILSTLLTLAQSVHIGQLVDSIRLLCSLGYNQRPPTKYPFDFTISENTDESANNNYIPVNDISGDSSDLPSGDGDNDDENDLDEESNSSQHQAQNLAPISRRTMKHSSSINLQNVDNNNSNSSNNIIPPQSNPIVGRNNLSLNRNSLNLSNSIFEAMKKTTTIGVDNSSKQKYYEEAYASVMTEDAIQYLNENFKFKEFDLEEKIKDKYNIKRFYPDFSVQKSSNNDSDLEHSGLVLDLSDLSKQEQEQCELISYTCARLLVRTSKNTSKFKTNLIKVTIQGADVEKEVAQIMHREIIMKFIQDYQRNNPSNKIIEFIGTFLTSRIYEGWWDGHIFDIFKTMSSYFTPSNFSKDFFLSCILRLMNLNNSNSVNSNNKGDNSTSTNNVKFMNELEGSRIINVFLHLKNINEFINKESFQNTIIEILYRNNLIRQNREILLKTFPVTDFTRSVNDNSFEEYFRELNSESSLNNITKCFLDTTGKFIKLMTDRLLSISQSRMSITTPSLIPKLVSYYKTVDKKIAYQKTAFKYHFYNRVNRNNIKLEEIVHDLFIDQYLPTKNSSLSLDISNRTDDNVNNCVDRSFMVVPSCSPFIVPQKMVPINYKYDLPFGTNCLKLPVPVAKYENALIPLKDKNDELLRARFAPSCFSPFYFPTYSSSMNITKLFKSIYGDTSSLNQTNSNNSQSNSASNNSNTSINLFQCFFMSYIEPIPCVGFFSRDDNLVILFNAKLTKLNLNENISVGDINNDSFNANNSGTNNNGASNNNFTGFNNSSNSGLLSNGMNSNNNSCNNISSSDLKMNNNITSSDNVNCKIELIDNNYDNISYGLAFTRIADGNCGRWSIFMNHVVLFVPFSEVNDAIPRKHTYLNIALEIYTNNGIHLSFLFSERERKQYITKLISCGNYKKNINNRTTLLSLENYTKMWINGEIPNFDYLLALNIHGSRSFNDLSQYPVFPWILSDYKSDEIDYHSLSNINSKEEENNSDSNSNSNASIAETNTDIVLTDSNSNNKNSNVINIRRSVDSETDAFFAEGNEFHQVMRKLEKPIAVQLDERVERFKFIYSETDPHYHYGTHYSHSAAILHFMMRVEPYTKLSLHLHTGWDHRDRLFCDIAQSWRSVTQSKQTDVKELIPEFFSFPAMFENVNRIDLPPRSDGHILDHVVLPPWAKDDPLKFVWIMRTALETPKVRASLHHWIDLIFGYKQRGKEAIDAINVYQPYCYDTIIKAKSKEDEDDDELSAEADFDAMVNFGQCPTQLFTSPHPVSNYAINSSSTTNNNGSNNNNSNNSVSIIKSLDLMDKNSERRISRIGHTIEFQKNVKSMRHNAINGEILTANDLETFLRNEKILIKENFLENPTNGSFMYFEDSILRCCCSFSSRFIAVALRNGIIRMIKEDFKEMPRSIFVDFTVDCMAISEKHFLLCASSSTSVYLFDITSGRFIRKHDIMHLLQHQQMDEKQSEQIIQIIFLDNADFIVFLTSNSIVVLGIDFRPIAFHSISNSTTASSTTSAITGVTTMTKFTALSVCDPAIWKECPFFVTGHANGHCYLWEIDVVEGRISNETWLMENNLKPIGALLVFSGNRAVAAVDEEGAVVVASVMSMKKKFLKKEYFDTCSICAEALDMKKAVVCDNCGLAICPKCFEKKTNLCIACHAIRDSETDL